MKDCIIDKYGLFIGLVSTPGNITAGELASEISLDLFGRHKKSRNTFAKINGAILDERLYAPLSFKAIGDQELIILSLIDDLSFPHRVFHPYHGNIKLKRKEKEGKDVREFDYQVLTCSNTYMEVSEKVKENTPVPLDVFLDDPKYPFISISKIKVSNYFLLGNGIHFLNLVKEGIYALSNRLFDPEKKILKTLVLDSFGSEELIILNFSKNLSLLGQMIHQTRRMQMCHLSGLGGYTNVFDHKLFDNQEDGRDWSKAHIFSAFNSILGYRSDPENKMNEYVSLNSDKIYIDFIADIKPGHEQNVKNELKKLNLKHLKIVNGKKRINSNTLEFYMVFESHTDGDIKSFLKEIELLKNFDTSKKHIRKIKLKLCTENDESGTEEQKQADGAHPKSELYDVLKIDDPLIVNLHKNLIKANISKVYWERIMKMYSNYNNCIQDPMFFASFMELYGYLQTGFPKRVNQYLEKDDNTPSQYFHDIIDRCIKEFEQAYYNRFHQSNRMSEMSEFNLEWNGGIQQVISALDCAFKELSSIFNNPSSQEKFINITGYGRVNTSDTTLGLNLLYVTYPELFAITICKEVFNFYWRDIITKEHEFKHEKFPDFLKENIEKNNKFNRNSNVHKYLLEQINREYINTLIADTLCFHFGYAGQIKSFTDHYWSVLYQSSLHYQKNGELSKEIFITFLSRLLLIDTLTKSDSKTSNFKLFEPHDPSLSDLWVQYFNDTASFVEILKNILNWRDFGSTFLHMLIPIMRSESISTTTSSGDPNEILLNYRTLFRSKVNEYARAFIQNTPVIPDSFSENNGLFITALSYAFIEYINNNLNKAGRRDNSCHILLRNKQGKPYFPPTNPVDNLPFYNILSDPHGGFFCTDPVIQQKCFQARILYYKALYHFAMIRKKEALTRVKQEKDARKNSARLNKEL